MRENITKLTLTVAKKWKAFGTFVMRLLPPSSVLHTSELDKGFQARLKFQPRFGRRELQLYPCFANPSSKRVSDYIELQPGLKSFM